MISYAIAQKVENKLISVREKISTRLATLIFVMVERDKLMSVTVMHSRCAFFLAGCKSCRMSLFAGDF